MIYSDYKGNKISKLGFGCMRFSTDPATGKIDRKKVNAMFDLAIKAGVNYFDTAYPYLGGESETAMAEALAKYPRESYYIADKFPGHSLPGPVDNVKLFNISLKKCNTDYFDFYLLHNVTEWSVKIYESEEYHIIPDMIKLKEEGKIRHLGMSFHGGNELLEKLLDKYDGLFEFVQIQCNYLDWTLQKAKEKCEIIRRHGLDIWVMEPCRGGKLAKLPEKASDKLKEFGECATDASYAFRFLQEIPGVKVILSGMNEISQVEDNLNTFREYIPLSDAQKRTLFEIAESMKQSVPCTACRYCCSGCPQELDIPYLIECYNNNKLGPDISQSVRIDGLDDDKKPAACLGCGQCTHACPQGIDVQSVIAELAEMYDRNPKWSSIKEKRAEMVERDLKER